MPTIQVPFEPSDLTADDVYDEIAALIAHNNQSTERKELTPQTARVLATWWQSPGRVGHVLAGFGTGVAVDRDELLADIAATKPEASTEHDRDALDYLASFVSTYEG